MCRADKTCATFGYFYAAALRVQLWVGGLLYILSHNRKEMAKAHVHIYAYRCVGGSGI